MSNVSSTSDQWFSKYELLEGVIRHELQVGRLHLAAKQVYHDNPAVDGRNDDFKGLWWRQYLIGGEPEAVEPIGGQLSVADLFSGAGGLANGVRHLCSELGMSVVSELVADQDEEATAVYAANHPTRTRTNSGVQQLVEYQVVRKSGRAAFAYPPELLDEPLARTLDGLDLVLAGPPCQGHSNLNNWTRRNDPRNDLYLTVPAFAAAVGAKMCVIENVPTVLRDSEGVVETAVELFESEGYQITAGMLSASAMGWPQTRKRHFLVARLDVAPIPLPQIASLLRDEPRSLWWGIGDLEDQVGDHPMRQVTNLSAENQTRIDWLFDNDEHDLDLEERPESHRGGTTYVAVYGRLKRNEPAPTITTGFTSPGRGRFTHPTRRRTLTPQEAARLQGFPDDYDFTPDPDNPPGRSQLSKWIGDAVPMPLGYAAALAALGPGWPPSLAEQKSSDQIGR